jgi:preprotein translocase subunit SecB
MAVPRKRKAQAENSQLIVTLKDTRLKKLSVEILLQVEEAAKGSMELSYNIFTGPVKDINSYPAILKIEGKGFNKEDASKVAFTIAAEMFGLFKLSRKPSDVEMKSSTSINIANFLAPVLSDTIETAMIKGGYPRLKIPRSFPPANDQAK